MKRCLAAIIVLCVVAGSWARSQEEPIGVTALMRAIDQAARTSEYRDVVWRAVDVGNLAVPSLRGVLARRDRDTRNAAVVALAYIGGSDAIAALQAEYGRRPTPETEAMLCYALGSRGMPEDRGYLARALRVHPDGEWYPIVAAELSLGVLRDRDAIRPLEATARRQPGNSESDFAEVALEWIRRPGPTPTVSLGASVADQIVAAVLRHGIPTTEAASEFSDRGRSGTWVRRGKDWSFKSGVLTAAPQLSFSVHVSPDDLRALVSVSVRFGPLSGTGYDYVLTSGGGTWNVRSVFFTWIS